jgi:hypothetical protein
LDRIPSKLQLDGGAGMLFGPERNECGFEAVAERLGAVKTPMAGHAERNQKSWVMQARPAVVDNEFPIRPTGPAAATIPV